jgi:CIC family chloride channel protein
MGAVFTSAARAPLTSVASVVELTGDYTLTLPVMLAVAIATAVSRAASYGTIYTTKLLRRGQDVDRAAPWRAFGDLKAAQAMRPFPAPLPVPRGSDGAAAGPDLARLPGRVSSQGDPQAVYAGESLAQTLRQLGVYGRDGLPVLSADGTQLQGWITNASVLRAVADQIGRAPRQARPAGAVPPRPLHGYQVLEVTLAPGSPAAGRLLGSIPWPGGSIPVSVLRDRSLTDPDPGLTLRAGDRVSLLTPAPEQVASVLGAEPDAAPGGPAPGGRSTGDCS